VREANIYASYDSCKKKQDGLLLWQVKSDAFFFLQEAVAYKALKANNHTSVSHEEQIARRGR